LKLKAIGIERGVVYWTMLALMQQKQRVRVNSEIGMPYISGVTGFLSDNRFPQRTILGSTFFNICIDNVPRNVTTNGLYTDDSKLIRPVDTQEGANSTIKSRQC